MTEFNFRPANNSMSLLSLTGDADSASDHAPDSDSDPDPELKSCWKMPE
ncbi:MAG: hypothetical protein GXY06_07955 [Clostridiaceae bacterium]|nr:hypothetical protein [Clostridiaceae bacterium]